MNYFYELYSTKEISNKNDYRLILNTIFNDKGRYFNFLRNIILDINKKYMYKNKKFKYKINFQKGESSNGCIEEKVENFLCLYVNIKEINNLNDDMFEEIDDKRLMMATENYQKDVPIDDDAELVPDESELDNDIDKVDSDKIIVENDNEKVDSDKIKVENDNDKVDNDKIKVDDDKSKVDTDRNKVDDENEFEINFEDKNLINKEFDIEIKMKYIDIKEVNKLINNLNK